MEMCENIYDAKFIQRDTDTIKISLNNKEEIYDIVRVYEFSSDRKMMSITVRRDGELFNFAKGADMMIKERLEKTGNEE